MTGDYVWQQIETLLGQSTQHVVLISPFIKRPVFAAILDIIPAAVSKVDCITRWSVAEVAAGVSDPEIADMALTDPRVSISLCHGLHAKIFVADDRSLVGSANLTGRATGRVQPANLELLLEVPTSHPEVQRVLHAAETASVPGTVDLARMIREQADLLNADEDRPRLLVQGDQSRGGWLPETRRPARLFGVYRGRTDNVATDLLVGIVRDLAHLDLPQGLEKETFGAAVLSRLYAIPEIAKLRSAGRLNMGDLQSEIESSGLVAPSGAQRAVETIGEWLRYFDEVYMVPVGPWEIRQGKELS